jgi:hypothetical protein
MVVVLNVWVDKTTGLSWTIDKRLRQFRRVTPDLEIIFVDYDSTEGRRMYEAIQNGN